MQIYRINSNYNIMTRFIKVPLRVRQELSKKFGVSRVAVNDALSYKFNSTRSQEIREAALAAGGEVVESAMWSECRTRHTDTKIIQTFGNGVVLDISKVDSSAEIRCYGEVCHRFYNVSMDMWGDLVEIASAIASEK